MKTFNKFAFFAFNFGSLYVGLQLLGLDDVAASAVATVFGMSIMLIGNKLDEVDAIQEVEEAEHEAKMAVLNRRLVESQERLERIKATHREMMARMN